MKIALINPRWDFANSIYFGCRAPHLPLELGYSRALLEQAGHEVLMLDGQIQDLTNKALAARVQDFAPAMTVVTTAPTYLFWRCAPPELRIPREVLTAIGGAGGMTVAVGPHGSATPAPVLRKLGVDLVIRGECEDAIAALAQAQDRRDIPGLAWIGPDGEVKLAGAPAVTRFTDTPALVWPQDWITRHTHHHHRFDTQPDGPGAEVEASRGCPYACTFCAKIDFRDSYRRRDLPILLAEIDALIVQGVTYLYFIDEIFLPRRDLLDALTQRRVKFGVQTRIDLWKPDMLDALGAAGCISIEAGIESLTAEGRAALAKKCRLDNDALSALLFRARRSVPFVQANLVKAEENEAENAISAARSSASPPGSATPSPSAANATSTPKFSKAIWPANSCSRRAAKHWPS